MKTRSSKNKKAATASETAMTKAVKRIVSRLVGQLTFLASSLVDFI